MLRKIKFKEFKSLYRKHIVFDFPATERPNLQGFRKRILENKEEVYIWGEEGQEKAYFISYPLEEYILISFLAVYKEQRGKGTGTKLLKEIAEKYKDKKGILLEVENPEFAKTQKEKRIQEKRIQFYEKSNYKIIENLKVKLFGVNFKIMIAPSKEEKIDKEEIKDKMQQFYETIIDKKRRKYITFD